MSGSQGSFTAQWGPTLDDPTFDLTVANYDKSTYTKRDKTTLHVQETADCRVLPTASKHKSMTYINCSIYRLVLPDDEQQDCSKHVEVNY
jgi:hypothetical protein